MSGDRTEAPTAQRKKQARKDGTGTSRTPDLGAWAGMLAASVVVPMALRSGIGAAKEMVAQVPAVIANPDPSVALHLLHQAVLAAAGAAAPMCGTLMLIGIVAAAAQGGLRPATKLLIPKFSRLNPFSGLKKMFGTHAIWELVKALVKTAVLAAVVYSVIRKLIPTLVLSGSLPLDTTLSTVSGGAVTLIRSASVAGLLMAAADYAVARRRTLKGLRMTKQEVKEEYKRTEGDPHLKGAIRSRQMAMSRNRMMADLPNADVVVVNPTHVAVALRYDPAAGAPRVVAKGAGAVAAKIRDVASENRIPLVQDVPLARALYATCAIGAEIPPDLYAAVARVLAFVMGLKSRGSAAGLHRPFPAAAAAAAA